MGLVKEIGFRAWMLAIALSFAFPLTSLLMPVFFKLFGPGFKFAGWVVFSVVVFLCDWAVMRFAKNGPLTRQKQGKLLLIFAVGVAFALLVSAQPVSR